MAPTSAWLVLTSSSAAARLVARPHVLVVEGGEVAVESLDVAPALVADRHLLVLFDEPRDGRLADRHPGGEDVEAGEHRRQVPGAVGRDHRVGVQELGHVVARIAPEQVGGLAVDAVAARPERRDDGGRLGGGPQRGHRVLGDPARPQGVEQVGLGVAVGSRAGEDDVEVGVVAVAAQHRVLDLAGLVQPGQVLFVAAGLVDVLFRLEHGLVRGLDLVAGVGQQGVAAVRGLEVGDRLLDLVEPALGRGHLVGRRRLGEGRLDALDLAVDLDPLAGEVAGHQVGLADARLVVEGRQRLADVPAVGHRRFDAGHQLGPLVEDVVAHAGPGRGGLLDGAHGVVGLGVRLLGVAEGVAGVLELAAQRGLVELGRLEVAELPSGVVDHLAGGVALLLDQHELAVGRLDVGAAGVEGAPRLLGRRS